MLINQFRVGVIKIKFESPYRTDLVTLLMKVRWLKVSWFLKRLPRASGT